MQHRTTADVHVGPKQTSLNGSICKTSRSSGSEHHSDVSAKIAVKMQALMRSVEEKKRTLKARKEKLMQAHDYILDLLRLGYSFSQIKNEGFIHEAFLTELFESLDIPITEKYNSGSHTASKDATSPQPVAHTLSSCDLSEVESTSAADHLEVPVKANMSNSAQGYTRKVAIKQLEDKENYKSILSDGSRGCQKQYSNMRRQSASDSINNNSFGDQAREFRHSPGSDRAAVELHRVLTKFQIDLRCANILASGEATTTSPELRQKIRIRYEDILMQLDGIVDKLGILRDSERTQPREQVAPFVETIMREAGEDASGARIATARSSSVKTRPLCKAISHPETASRSPQSHHRLPDKEEPHNVLIEDSFVRIKKNQPQSFTPYHSMLSSNVHTTPVSFATGTEDMLCPVETLNGGCEDPKCPYTHFQLPPAKD
ncbi:AaceriABR208Wp [[Ashbya] aceris (nom. inval.)]|nr:AaceriABR208Wp [[Ashbya] aceris (nom. inval.)]